MKSFIVCILLCVLSLDVFAQSSEVGALSSIQFNWVAPTQRENGAALTADDIGGYELRYRLKAANAYLYVTIPSGIAKSYTLTGIGAGEYEYQIAVYDKDGLFSNWVAIVPMIASSPKPVTNATAKRLGVDVKADCVAPNCKVAVRGEYK